MFNQKLKSYSVDASVSSRFVVESCARVLRMWLLPRFRLSLSFSTVEKEIRVVDSIRVFSPRVSSLVFHANCEEEDNFLDRHGGARNFSNSGSTGTTRVFSYFPWQITSVGT